jgi:hypothetical protein
LLQSHQLWPVAMCHLDNVSVHVIHHCPEGINLSGHETNQQHSLQAHRDTLSVFQHMGSY